jgi:glycerol-3-phosphate dehydrogenase
MNLFSRSSLIEQLETSDTWDLIVIGGGATGLGIALDAITRGYKTLLLEQVDFAKGTSSRSTKLVHGGVRYLAQGNVKMVHEALYERDLLLNNAPHLVKDQTFIIPVYTRFDKIFYWLGLKFYDMLAGKMSFGKSVRLNRKNTMKRLSTLCVKNLIGGIVYHDGQFDDSRLAVNIAQSCIEQGATVLNHFKVTRLLKDKNGFVCGVSAEDQETKKSYRLNTKTVINATGVFADEILTLDNENNKKTICPSQGIHLVLDKSFLPGNDAVMIPKTDDGRVLFIVPWQRKLIVGTTDTLVDELSLEPQLLQNEIEFILSTINRYLKKKVSRSDVLTTYAGLRPLAAPQTGKEKTKEISRSHKIYVSASNLITIIGGKWTTYRKMAEDTIDKTITLRLLPKRNCATKSFKIHGSVGHVRKKDLLAIYGSDQKEIKKLIDNSPELAEKLHPELEYLKAEIVWAVRNEMARTVEDVLSRRVRILFHNARLAVEVAPKVARIIARELNKDQLWIDNQLEKFNKICQKYIL